MQASKNHVDCNNKINKTGMCASCNISTSPINVYYRREKERKNCNRKMTICKQSGDSKRNKKKKVTIQQEM